MDNGDNLTQTFASGAFDTLPSGDTLVVLDDQSDAARQIVVVRVLYKPRLGARADHPTAVNAAIDWYFIADPSNLAGGFLHYEGAGFVSLKMSDRRGKFEIRNATVALKESIGGVEDPVGRATLAGKFKVDRDSAKISMIAQELRALASTAPTTGSTTEPTTENQPPPRTTSP